MKHTIWIIMVMLRVVHAVPAQNPPRDLYSDTWVGVDGLGREVPTHEQCGAPRPGRTVGMFYFLWLGQHGQSGPYDITQLLAANPDNPSWGPPGAFHHWGKSELGYYTSDSEYVIRKHVSMLNDAGIDVLIFDVTNAVTYPGVYLKLCRIYTELRSNGHRTPQICFLAHSDAQRTIETLYRDFYAKNLFPDLWFRWKGKPLILGDDWEGLPEEIRRFFTLRKCWAWTHGKDTWQWLDHSENRYGWHESPDRPEELAVSVAEHPTTNIGRSFQNGKQPPINSRGLTGTEDRGLFFAEQCERALKMDPEFVFVTGWNEWVAQRFIQEATANPGHFLGKPLQSGQSFFVDAYNQEYSRDIEPMSGGHTDNYYYQLVGFVRRYKGVRPIPVAGRDYAITIDGQFDDWLAVTPEFRDTIGDIEHRDEKSWGDKEKYLNTSGRNDFETLKVACDSSAVYFYAKTRNIISPRTDPRWMLLLINSDGNYASGWQGYDLLVNHEVLSPDITTVSIYKDGKWVRTASISYSVKADQIELAIPRETINIREKTFQLDFHWADHPQNLDNPIDLILNGDSAPNRRFNYRFIRRGSVTWERIPPAGISD